jgi:hypothetical protein
MVGTDYVPAARDDIVEGRFLDGVSGLQREAG